MDSAPGVILDRPLMPPSLPLLIEAPPDEPGLAGWLERHRATYDAALLASGAVLFRGFALPSGEGGGFEGATRLFFDQALSYVYRSTPRTEVGKGVYTATEYPKQLIIPQHSENAYARDWPLKLCFFCELAATSGGETTLSDNRVTTAALSERVKQRFLEKGICYVRNYGAGVDLSWQVVFQTKDRAEVERYCAANGIDFEWRKDKLRTRQVCQAMAAHPVTGEQLWFNQAHLFHVSSLDPKTRQAMLQLFKPDELPRNAYYGDGSELEPEVLEEIRAAYRGVVGVPWKKGDVLVVDNMLAAHGRNPFDGPRKVLVSMGEAYSAVSESRAAR